MSALRHGRLDALWRWTTGRWNRTPGYLKWIGGLVLGAVIRFVFARLFPESWQRISHSLFTPTMPVWLAVAGLVAVLVLERTMPALYRHARRARTGGLHLRSLFGVRWAVPPGVERVQGPYCAACPTRLRGTMWSGEASPTLWTCPSCGREYSTPEFPDIIREVERQLGVLENQR